MKALTLVIVLMLCALPICAQSSNDTDWTGFRKKKKEKPEPKDEFKNADKDRFKRLVITSTPPGARVEMNGEFVGLTPYSRSVEDYVYKGAGNFLWSKYLNTAISLTVSKEGHVAKTQIITNGPLGWYDLNGQLKKVYYVITSPEFHFKLEPIGDFLGANPLVAANSPAKASASSTTITGEPVKLSTEDIVQSALPAVVTVKSSLGTGSGFFILDTGIVATNRHVVGASQAVSVITAKGESLSSESIFVHPTRDLALIKVKEAKFPFIPIANPASVQVGADVVAIGSPGGITTTLRNTVTKGIISAFRETSEDGLLIQTDAAINSGNSGGPLLNNRAEVVGINSLKINGVGKEGLGFALFASEILQMLKQHFNFTPQYQSAFTPSAKEAENKSRISVQVTSEPGGAEIYVDGNFLGSTPSTLQLLPGEHILKVSRPGFKAWERKVTVEVGTSKTFNAIFEK
jgi:S1-C subfamily serine protease